MPWGLFGPVSFRTRRGTRVTFFAGVITLPLAGLSLWSLTRPPPPEAPPPPARLEECRRQ
jgi:hypothetical protein